MMGPAIALGVIAVVLWIVLLIGETGRQAHPSTYDPRWQDE